jgi:hypothetical protein
MRLCITEGEAGWEGLSARAKFLLHLAVRSGYNSLFLRSEGSEFPDLTVSIEGCCLGPDIHERGEVWAEL